MLHAVDLLLFALAGPCHFLCVCLSPSLSLSLFRWSRPVCTSNVTQMCMGCTGPGSSRAILKTMGYSVRVDQWRFTVWLPFNTSLYTGDWAQPPIATELYDHRNSSDFDFDMDGEATNVAGQPEFAGINIKMKLKQRFLRWRFPNRLEVR